MLLSYLLNCDAAAKGATVHLTKLMSAEFVRASIRVNSIAPGESQVLIAIVIRYEAAGHISYGF